MLHDENSRQSAAHVTRARVHDESLTGNFIRFTRPARPRVQGAHQETKFIPEQRAKLKPPKWRGSKPGPGQFDDYATTSAEGVSPGSIWMRHCGKLSLNSRSTLGRRYWHEVGLAPSASGRGPTFRGCEPFPGLVHLRQDSLRMQQELFAGLGEHNRFAQPVQKTTLNFSL